MTNQVNRPYQLCLLLCFIAAIILCSCKRPPLPPPVVLFDQGHGQSTTISDDNTRGINKLAALFKEQGFTVKSHISPLTDKALAKIDALVISGPRTPFTTSEQKAIWHYLNNGGQLCLMIHSSASVTNLLTTLQVAIANGVIREQKNIIDNNNFNFSLSNLPKHPLTKELKSFNVYGAWPLNTALEANVIAKSSLSSWVDLNNDSTLGSNDAVASFAVLITGQIGHGHFIVIGDDELFENRYMEGGNERLGENIAKWLKAGSYY